MLEPDRNNGGEYPRDVSTAKEHAAEKVVRAVRPTVKGPVTEALPEGVWEAWTWCEKLEYLKAQFPQSDFDCPTEVGGEMIAQPNSEGRNIFRRVVSGIASLRSSLKRAASAPGPAKHASVVCKEEDVKHRKDADTTIYIEQICRLGSAASAPSCSRSQRSRSRSPSVPSSPSLSLEDESTQRPVLPRIDSGSELNLADL